jgi:DnaK suppressor protein
MTQLELIKYRTSLKKKYAKLVDANRSHGTLTTEPAARDTDQTQVAQDRDSKLLHDVRSALDRIAAGKFGICVDCEYDISPKRLAAIPWAASCIVCEEEARSRAAESPSATEESVVRVA